MLTDQVEGVRSHPLPEDRLQNAALKTPARLLKTARDAIEDVIAIHTEFTASPRQPWAVENWLHLAGHAASKIREIEEVFEFRTPILVES